MPGGRYSPKVRRLVEWLEEITGKAPRICTGCGKQHTGSSSSTYCLDCERKRSARRRGLVPYAGDGSAPYWGGLDRFDAHVEAGLCIWHCMTVRPCREKAVERGGLCPKHLEMRSHGP